jgi:hypothetical protein
MTQVNLIYAAYGRLVDSVMLEAYMRALEDRSDYQVECAVAVELATPSGKPIDAASLRMLAKNFARSAEEDERREREKRRQESQPKLMDLAPAHYEAHRQALRDTCRQMIDADEFGQSASDSYAREMLEVLEVCDGDPTQEVAKVLFGIRQRRKNQRQQTKTKADLHYAITRANQVHA